MRSSDGWLAAAGRSKVGTAGFALWVLGHGVQRWAVKGGSASEWT